MADLQFDSGMGRRDIFRFAALTGLSLWAETYAFAASDFWNKKKPAEWTEQEIQELRTKSPWAKKVDADVSGGRGGGAAWPTWSRQPARQAAYPGWWRAVRAMAIARATRRAARDGARRTAVLGLGVEEQAESRHLRPPAAAPCPAP